MQVPLISVVTAPDMPWMHERLGSVDNPSYLVVANEPYAGRMDLWHRLQNVVAYACSNLLHKVTRTGVAELDRRTEANRLHCDVL